MQKAHVNTWAFLNLAEREGFEPSLGINLNTLSRRAPSATQPSLRDLLQQARLY